MLRSPHSPHLAILLWLACLAVTTAALRGQCETSWTVGSGEFAVDGEVVALARWDPDGPGPLPLQLVVGGAFSAAGGLAIDNLVLFDPAARTWSAIGGGTDGTVVAIAPMPNGELCVAGSFSSIDGLSADGIAVWNGSAWTAPGPVDGTVRALTTTAGGELIAGGQFTAIGGVAMSNVGAFDGASWRPLATGLTEGNGISVPPGVSGLDRLANGDIVAVGAIAAAGALPLTGIAVWDGVAWSAPPPIQGINIGLACVLAEPQGSFLVGGGVLSGASVQRWNGSAWAQLTGITGKAVDLVLLPGGDLVAVTNANGPGVLRWNGASWSTLASFSIFFDRGNAVAAAPSGSPDEFFVGGRLASLNGAYGNNLFLWDGTGFVGEPAAPNGPVDDLVATPDGELYAVGDFTSLGSGVATQRIARWADGWLPLAAGLPHRALAMTALAGGDLVASTTGGVYRYDGTAWQLLPGSPSLSGRASMLVRASGELLVGGNSLHRWTGGQWLTVAAASSIVDMANLPNGDVVLTGEFPSSFPIATGLVAAWDGGATWTALDPTLEIADPGRVAVLPDGDIVVAGDATAGVWRHEGASWAELGNLDAAVRDLDVDPAGEIVVTGSFTASAGSPAYHAARWDGSQWQPIAGGAPAPGRLIAARANGDVFALVEPSPTSRFLARHETACPASAGPTGVGCIDGNGVLNEITPTTLPLLGATYTALATGLPDDALVLDLYGTQAITLPMDVLFLIGHPGCTLGVAPVAAGLATAPNGSVSSQLAIPAQAGLVGFSLLHQMMVFEVDPHNVAVTVTVTDMLRLTLGRGY